MVVVRMIVGMGVIVVVIFTQQEGTKKVDPKSYHCNRDCLIEGNGHGAKKSTQALVADKQRDHRKRDSAREGSQVPELPCSKDETVITRIATRVGIGQGSDKQRARMGRHVKAVRNERDRTIPKAADDLGNH